MARALHLALAVVTLVAGAGAARYGGGEYAVHMPAYGDDEPPLDRDDYRAHSPDAPAALDYKYEEDFKGKTEQSSGVEANDEDSWRRPVRKHRKIDSDFRLDDSDKFERDRDDDFPKKSMNRFTKHRPWHKSHKFEENDEERPRFMKRPVRDRRDDMPELGGDEMETEKDHFLDDTSRLQGEKYRFAVRTSSVRPRRRPRDRLDIQPRRKEDDESIEQPGFDRDIMWPSSLDKNKVDQDLLDRQFDEQTLRAHTRPPLRPFRVDSEEDEPALLRPLKDKGQGRAQYNNYNDYYDMKRAMNIKNKLPPMRRTEAGQRLVPAPMPVRSSTELLPNRRMFRPPSSTPGTPRRTIPSPPSTAAETEASSRVVTHTTTRTTTTTSVITSIATDRVSVNASKELSLAEKSRLSILKKSQRKESGRSDVSTKKPPVLLQVTQRLQTVLMVEPPSSGRPWMRASEVMNDSPMRLQKVRRLMRQKLLANARNIHDLTDNWDDVVCDYVDMSLLENAAHIRRLESHQFSLLCVLYVIWYRVSSVIY